MEANMAPAGRLRRTVDDLIIAEVFLVQATIESASVIGDGLLTLRQQITGSDDARTAGADTLGHTLQRIADDALEPYTSRLKYLRELKNLDA